MSNFSDQITRVCPDFVAFVFLARNIAKRRGDDDTNPDIVKQAMEDIFNKLCKGPVSQDTVFVDIVSKARAIKEESKKDIGEALENLQTIQNIRSKIKDAKTQIVKEYQDVVAEFKNILEMGEPENEQVSEQKFNEVLDAVLEEVANDSQSILLDKSDLAASESKFLGASKVADDGTNPEFDELFERNVVYRDNGVIQTVPGRGGGGNTLSEDYLNMLAGTQL